MLKRPFLLAMSCMMLGCASVPSERVVLARSSAPAGDLRVMVDNRRPEERVSGAFSTAQYSAFRYGDEHFDPPPIHLLDAAVRNGLGGRIAGRQVKIERLDILEIRSVLKNLDKGAAGVAPGLSPLLAELRVPWGGGQFACRIFGYLGDETLYVTVDRAKEKDIGAGLAAVTRTCVDSFVKDLDERLGAAAGM